MQEMLAIQAYDSVYEPDGFNEIGWIHFSRFLDNKYTVVGHTGQTMAHSALVAIVPEIQLGVVLLTNSPGNGGLEKIAGEILRVTHAVKTRKKLSSIAATDENRNSLYETETSFDGQYVSSFGYIDICRYDESYRLYIDGKKMKLSGNNEGSYSLKAQLLGFIPFQPLGLGDLSFFVREVFGGKIILHRGRWDRPL